MIKPRFFIDTLKKNDIEFFAGVPDSLLKNVCAYITENSSENNNIIAANEGAAIGLAAGYYLATSKIPVVYMQNSGEGNVINPLISLMDKEVYNIPVLLIIGWRGKPEVKDEPQHKKQGIVTLPILEAIGIRYDILSKDEQIAEQQILEAVTFMNETKEAYALIIEKDTFDEYELINIDLSDLTLGREDAIKIVSDFIKEEDVTISTTGMISRELFEYREIMRQGHNRDFLTVGSMGHASQIALGLALHKPNRKVFCFDGDGAVIMHMGSMAIIAQKKPKNYYHIVFNNGAHDSVGGQPTVGLNINLRNIAIDCGYAYAWSVSNKDELINILPDFIASSGPVFLEIKVKKGNRKDLGRPTSTPVQNKESLMEFLKL